jgi:hypothetical protein
VPYHLRRLFDRSCVIGLVLFVALGAACAGDRDDANAEIASDVPGLSGTSDESWRIDLRASRLLMRESGASASQAPVGASPGPRASRREALSGGTSTCRAGEDGWRPFAPTGHGGTASGFEQIFPRAAFDLCYAFDAETRTALPGETLHFSWHLVTLPEASPPRTLLIRIHPRPGTLFQLRDLFLGTESAHIFAVLRGQVDRFSLGVFFCLIGFFTILLSIVRYGERVSILSFNVLSFSIGAFTISLSDYSRLVYDRPDFWLQVSFFSLFIVPVALGVLTEQVLDSRFRRIVRVLWIIHALHAVIFVSVFAFTGLRYHSWLIISVFGMSLISLVVFSAGALRQAWFGSPGTRIYTLGFFFFVATCLYDIAGGYLGRLEWERYTFHRGMLAFIFSLGYVLERRFEAACESFHTVLALNPTDRAARLYLERSEFYAQHGTPPDREGVQVLDQK